MRRKNYKLALLGLAWLVVPTFIGAYEAAAQQDRKPNIVIIWGDDIGQSNLSTYTNGLMGYRTPNIDSIAQQGVIFTDYYGEQSCTAGRSAFITGQSSGPVSARSGCRAPISASEKKIRRWPSS